MQEKHLKQKLLSEVAQAVISKNGVPLSISEHEAVVAKVKCEIAVARDELASIADRAMKSMFLKLDALKINSFMHCYQYHGRLVKQLYDRLRIPFDFKIYDLYDENSISNIPLH